MNNFYKTIYLIYLISFFHTKDSSECICTLTWKSIMLSFDAQWARAYIHARMITKDWLVSSMLIIIGPSLFVDAAWRNLIGTTVIIRAANLCRAIRKITTSNEIQRAAFSIETRFPPYLLARISTARMAANRSDWKYAGVSASCDLTARSRY